jgi:hypothetical protein
MARKQQLEPAQISDEEASLVNVFNETQTQIKSLLEEEHRLQQELLQLGIESKSVLDECVPVFNQQQSVQQPMVITDEMVNQYVREQKTTLAKMLYEGVVVREESRKSAVDIIVKNSNGIYTADELMEKPTNDLNKLAQLLKVAIPQQQTTWTGAGFVDSIVSVQNAREPGSGQEFLTLPKLFN